MKQVFTVICCLYMLCISSQDVVRKDLGAFSILKVYDLLNVEMIEATDNYALIKGAAKYDVEFVNRNGILKIRMSPEKSFDGDDTFVTVYYRSIDVIDANEGAQIDVKSIIDQYEIDLRSQEGAEIEAELKVTYANIKAITGGIINTTGAAKNQDVSVYTGGIYEGEKLETIFSEVSIQAGGEVSVNCKDQLEIKIRAGGNVYVYGDPKLIDENRVFGGSVKRME